MKTLESVKSAPGSARVVEHNQSILQTIVDIERSSVSPERRAALLAALARRLALESLELQNHLEAATLAAVTDPLTQLFNRQYLNERLDAELERSDRYGAPFSLIMFDVDHFKSINDTFGHDAGDRVLQRAAEVTSLTMRKTDVCARWGGEEFLILAVETDEAHAVAAAERLRACLEAQEFEGELPRVTASFGVASFHRGDTRANLLKRVDTCLYAAKRTGRNRVVAASDLRSGAQSVNG